MNKEILNEKCEILEKIIIAMAELYCSNECKHIDDEYRKKMSEQGKENAHFMVNRIITDGEREIRSIQMTERWKDPTDRENLIKKLTKKPKVNL